ncbi:hypothetical protein [Rhizobium ruizarguesonis]|uniref:hypothetical protein n=1 Tax=Rhizobium ruizarguesonis TaxID=2081791 RepID=UPI001030CB5E|nr:hypothetical protein [Rhizobium ruizarguesonis]TAW18458.1 hypothetical protein ELI25_22995 [Rhizobium ruizarguesonis]TAZ54033.1 hypothetical protein ELH76_24185 [Rhizobium ruizarguesonis]
MTKAEIDDEMMRVAEARLLQFVAAQPVHIGIAMSRRLGKPRYHHESKPAPKLSGPKPDTRASKTWRNQLIYRVWRSCYPQLGPASFAKIMVDQNTRYLTSAAGYISDWRRGEPPLDQLKAACYLIRAKRLAVPEKGLRNILEAMHKNSERDFPG